MMVLTQGGTRALIDMLDEKRASRDRASDVLTVVHGQCGGARDDLLWSINGKTTIAKSS